MAVLKCKMCGGDLSYNEGETIAICQYCGTKQTLPRLNDGRKANLYDRASHFRKNNEFDKAMAIYEQILDEDKTDAESYWSIILCRYGIEYVEDTKTHERVPTVNRMQFTSIFADEDYKLAIQYADSMQKEIYEEEAKRIDNIQKEILQISQKEEPYDIFISYKETDESGRRTRDSVIATELYNELIKEDFKVFFSRVTLEDKIGTAYEPYIFSALNSAKVMVVIGTKKEHFEATWVKNEWSRYLALIKNGAKKTLIPAYRDMDPYDLPEEFSHLQAQDMSKLGFMQDLLRGIKKIIDADNKEEKSTEKNKIIYTNDKNIQALLDRGNMALEDKEWEKADGYFEQVLNIDSRSGEAYLGKFLIECHCESKESLKDCLLSKYKATKMEKILVYDNEKFQRDIEKIVQKYVIENFLDRDELYKVVYDSVGEIDISYDSILSSSQEKYDDFCNFIESNQNIHRAYQFLDESKKVQIEKMIESVKESLSKQVNEAQKIDKNYIDNIKRRYQEYINKYNEEIQKVYEKANVQREHEYKEACELENKAKNILQYIEAKKIFEKLVDYKETNEHIQKCNDKIRKKKQQKIKKAIIIIPTIAIILIAICIIFFEYQKANNYDNAIQSFSNHEYEKAVELFSVTGDYKDSKEKLKEAKYEYAVQLMEEEKYERALNLLNTIENYKNRQELIEECEFYMAINDFYIRRR